MFYSNYAAKLLNSINITKQAPQFLISNVHFCGKEAKISHSEQPRAKK
jgi:hypothetical protein